MRFSINYFIGFLVILLSMNAQANSETNRHQLLSLIKENTITAIPVEKLIEINTPFFQEKVAQPYRTCLGKEMTPERYNLLSNKVNESYVNSLSDEQVHEMVTILKPFTDSNSLSSIFESVKKNPKLDIKDFSVFNSPKATTLITSPNYESLRKIIGFSNQYAELAKTRVFLVAVIAAKECGTELQ